jgi:hypothetical protein
MAKKATQALQRLAAELTATITNNREMLILRKAELALLKSAHKTLTTELPKVVTMNTSVGKLTSTQVESFKGTRRAKFDKNVGELGTAISTQVISHKIEIAKIEAMMGSLSLEVSTKSAMVNRCIGTLGRVSQQLLEGK